MTSPTSQPRRKTDWVDWRFELVALVWSGFSLIGLALLVLHLDGHAIPEWKNVTINSLVSVISVSMKASFMYAVAELIGQWKWISFSRNARLLMDFEHIDQASRGLLWSRGLIGRVRGLWPLRFSTLVFLFAIAIDPFSQQLLQFRQGIVFVEAPSRFFSKPDAYTKQANSYTMGGKVFAVNQKQSEKDPNMLVQTVSAHLDYSMQSAFYKGLSNPGNAAAQLAITHCPSEICTWPRFQTLGVCHKCNDLTSDLQKVDNFGEAYGVIYGGSFAKENATALVLPNGHFLANINECTMRSWHPYCYLAGPDVTAQSIHMSSFGTASPNKTNSMKDIDTLIWSMSIINVDFKKIEHIVTPSSSSSLWPDSPVRATECALYYCVKNIDVKVENNTISENTTRAADAKREPGSFKVSDSELTDLYSPENIPPENMRDSLEFDEHYSFVRHSDLVLSFPNDSNKPSYKVDSSSVWSLGTFVQNLLSANITNNANTSAAISKVLPNGSVGFNGVIVGRDNNYPQAIDQIWNSKKDNIPETFEALATSITNELRDVSSNNPFDRKNIYVGGSIGSPKTYYKAEWGWIALHGLLLLVGFLFWCLTVWSSLRSSKVVPAWKNSSLAVISRGSIAADMLKDTELAEDMVKRANAARVIMPVQAQTTSTSSQANGGRNCDMFEMQRRESPELPPYSPS